MAMKAFCFGMLGGVVAQIVISLVRLFIAAKIQQLDDSLANFEDVGR